MSNKELELRLINLEKAVSELARRTSNRDNTNENNISNVESETNTSITEVEEALCENYEEQMTVNTDVEEALCEIYEMILEEE